jgi:SAM-dependent methyltransferase
MSDGPVGNVYDKETASNPIERRLVGGFTEALLALLPDRAHRVLEVGCGEGNQLRRLCDTYPDAEIVGLDIGFDEGAAGDGADLVVGSAATLPFPDDTFDLVVGLEVLEHLPDPAAALREIGRVGRGPVILSVPWEPVWRIGNVLRGRYVGAFGNTPGHLQHFSRSGFVRLVSRYLAHEETRRPLPWTMVRARCSEPVHASTPEPALP